MNFNFLEIVSAFMVLFAVIDIIGSLPVILDLKARGSIIEAGKVSTISLGILFAFLVLGEPLLNVFGVDITSFAIAGSFVLFILAVEMILGIEIFKHQNLSGVSIVPIAFPLVAGAGSITTILSLKAEYSTINIALALILNIACVYIVLRLAHKIEKILGGTGVLILRKIFGIILLAIAIRLFISNLAISLENLFPGLFNK